MKTEMTIQDRSSKNSATKGPDPILSVRHLKKYFPVRSGWFTQEEKFVHAADDVSFDIRRGEVLGLVGESGCGKTTLGRLLMRLLEPTSGQVLFEGRDIIQMGRRQLRVLRQKIQIIFQDPYASLNPRMTVGDILEEPFIVHHLEAGSERRSKIQQLLATVGLSGDAISRYPHEFSGGQRQRIGIARALATHPEFIVADEPVSSLDVSIQAQIINLLEDLQEEYHLSMLFISHDLNIVRHISDRVAVMYLGRIVEIADSRELFTRPMHPYTQALLSAIPIPDPKSKRPRILLEGDLPSPVEIPAHCRFYSRCPKRIPDCLKIDPPLYEVGNDHQAACILVK